MTLVGRYLRAGVIVDGVLEPTHEGTPQGGPASPLLANILLDDLDKELERRGLPFVRYADDFVIFTKSMRSAQRVFASVKRYLTEQLRLVVNQEKSRIVASDGVAGEFRWSDVLENCELTFVVGWATSDWQRS